MKTQKGNFKFKGETDKANWWLRYLLPRFEFLKDICSWRISLTLTRATPPVTCTTASLSVYQTSSFLFTNPKDILWLGILSAFTKLRLVQGYRCVVQSKTWTTYTARLIVILSRLIMSCWKHQLKLDHQS